MTDLKTTEATYPRKGLGKKILTAVLAVLLFTAVTAAVASATEIYVGPGELCTTIALAVTASNQGDTIIVRDGTYSENVNVGKQLTIRSENGSTSCIVNAADPNDDVFEVTVNYVNISGFTVTGATDGGSAGIYLDNGVSNCNIFDNNASYNFLGIYLPSSSDNNTLANNTANSNDMYGILLMQSCNNNTLANNTANSNTQQGIVVEHSNNNTLTDNTANSNGGNGIYLWSSSNNTLTDNTANSNTMHGIYLYLSCNNNTLTGNTANSNTGDDGSGIYLWESCNNTITNNTALSNKNGIHLYESCNNTFTNNTANSNTDHGSFLWSSSNNTFTRNTLNSNTKCGIYMDSSSNNSVSCNWVQNSTVAGFYLINGSTNNILENNSIIANGIHQFYNNQSDDVNAANNWWGTNNQDSISESIYDWQDDQSKGNVTYLPPLAGPDPCAPIPELPTVVLFSVGLVALAGCVVYNRRSER